MAVFNNLVFNVYTQSPINLSLSLTGSDSSVVFDTASAVDNTTLVVPASVFTTLSGTQVHFLSSNPLFSSQDKYWQQMSTTGWQLSSPAFTSTQWSILCGLYASHSIGYLNNQYRQLTASFGSTSQILAGYNFRNSQAPEAVGIAYNALGTGTANTTIYIPDGIKLRVSNGYHGANMAVIYSNRASTVFTVNTAVSGQTLSGSLTWDNQTAEDRRRFALNG